jgi:hypothetical protein
LASSSLHPKVLPGKGPDAKTLEDNAPASRCLPSQFGASRCDWSRQERAFESLGQSIDRRTLALEEPFAALLREKARTELPRELIPVGHRAVVIPHKLYGPILGNYDGQAPRVTSAEPVHRSVPGTDIIKRLVRPDFAL